MITLLAAVSVVAARWPVSLPAEHPDKLEWVRTTDGWEKHDRLQLALQPAFLRTPPALHPLTLAALQTLGAALVLTAAGKSLR